MTQSFYRKTFQSYQYSERYKTFAAKVLLYQWRRKGSAVSSVNKNTQLFPAFPEISYESFLIEIGLKLPLERAFKFDADWSEEQRSLLE